MMREPLPIDDAGLLAGDAPAARHGEGTQGKTPGRLAAAVTAACSRVPPLWPLDHFVAVNPFLGLADRRFEDACALTQRIMHGDMLMPPSYYLRQIAAGRIAADDLRQALERAEPGIAVADIGSLQAELAALPEADAAGAGEGRVLTVADALDQGTGSDWSALVVEEIAKWCAAYFDQGQSAWRMPWRSAPLYQAWKQVADLDRSPELAGIRGFRGFVAGLPEDPMQAIAAAVAEMEVPAAGLEDLLHRELATIAGWSAYVQYRVREKALRGEADDSLVHLLAIRLSWDLALFRAFGVAAQALDDGGTAGTAEGRRLRVLGVAQAACETAMQRDLVSRLRLASAAGEGGEEQAAKTLQAVFCIDVRSEVYRRALEGVSPQIETLGFAGFFGFPIEYVPFGHRHGSAQCPVLLTPKYRVRETVAGAAAPEIDAIAGRRALAKRIDRAWRSFKTSAVSCFPFVEAAGLLFGPKLVTDSLGLTRPADRPGTEGLDRAVLGRMGPTIERSRAGAAPPHDAGIAPAERVSLARNALRGMGLTAGLARLVLLCGHGSHTANNPYGSALDCGACGGHSGEANARVAASVFNDAGVRAGLAGQGIVIPRDTWFVAGLHDTTTDTIRLFDREQVPASHAEDLARVETWLAAASRQARHERRALLGIAAEDPGEVAKALAQRSRDWSQVRPEWGLAGNAAFIAAPRARTRGLDLRGRVFLHNYDHGRDPDETILDLIMSAPMVVASWINLQYYASTVNNRRFGSGNKVLHNVVGTLGVVQGNGGDLQVGLPWQSVHDGRDFVHEPLRLTVMIEAPLDAIERVIARHEDVRRLVDNGWVHLLAIAEGGSRFLRYGGGSKWMPVN
jgi:uncharacterized protein YbcC (UPF0753/DUF2309 family)